MEKKCTVNFIFSIMLTLLSLVLLFASFSYHDKMREELYSNSQNKTTDTLEDTVSADTAEQNDVSSSLDGTTSSEALASKADSSSLADTEENVNVIPPAMTNYLITYGVSFISAAFSMLYSYRVFKNSKRRYLVLTSYCIFAVDIFSIAIGLLVRLGMI